MSEIISPAVAGTNRSSTNRTAGAGASSATSGTNNSTTTNTDTTADQQAKAIADAVEQLKAASNAVYQAFTAVGTASGDLARFKVIEGRSKAQEMGTKAETAISEKPLMYVGIAFAAGWLLSRLSK